MKRTAACALPLLALFLLATSGCTKNSEARIVVTNTGVRPLVVVIDNESTTIAVGGSDTLTMTWPGGYPLDLEVSYFPVGEPYRVRYAALTLEPGETRTLALGFES
jgi:hypothetical protein